MNDDLIGAMLGLGVVVGVGYVASAYRIELPILVGLLIVVIVLWALFWRSFLLPAIDPVLGGH